ncbi:uncharacterized protein GLRG_06497 [Colletotrichum graminicola M1.001]|uniref:Uncharacterized protein n=1 Tax=Colletotrichum graminicola (strain M1.001 / M2 / FGSC 10212) TaxID=645133 RepID=E3QKG5_COLGM|nr:uncharacterized protein GLRG_06497 [Colletotrichum graminicola M1.001]EFQ31353.1 hypothetical protein GLRG_06497 [Colletotrichum graminicola M1.001]
MNSSSSFTSIGPSASAHSRNHLRAHGLGDRAGRRDGEGRAEGEAEVRLPGVVARQPEGLRGEVLAKVDDRIEEGPAADGGALAAGAVVVHGLLCQQLGRAKENFESREIRAESHHGRFDPADVLGPEEADKFMSFEEYSAHWEVTSKGLIGKTDIRAISPVLRYKST